MPPFPSLLRVTLTHGFHRPPFTNFFPSSLCARIGRVCSQWVWTRLFSLQLAPHCLCCMKNARHGKGFLGLGSAWLGLQLCMRLETAVTRWIPHWLNKSSPKTRNRIPAIICFPVSSISSKSNWPGLAGPVTLRLHTRLPRS